MKKVDADSAIRTPMTFQSVKIDFFHCEFFAIYFMLSIWLEIGLFEPVDIGCKNC